MPIYEYKCAAGHKTTRIVAFSEFAEQIPCPRCNHGRRVAARRGSMAKLEMSQTAPPKFKAGGAGGFYKPNA